MIEYKVFFGFFGLGVIVYILLRIFSSKEQNIDKEIEDVLNSDEYKVKGQYDYNEKS